MQAADAGCPNEVVNGFRALSTKGAIARPAIVMNMFYTGLGIARSLSEHGVDVIGLSAHTAVYGNFTRCAKVVRCPDSRHAPAALLDFLIALGERAGARPVIFPTRDDDVIFLDRFRGELKRYFDLAIADGPALHACLNKWETFLWATQTGVPTPRCWRIDGFDDIKRCMEEAVFPCVLKAVASHHWRQGENWELVGARKVIPIHSACELEAEYAGVARADKHALLQEMVPGSDDSLIIVACYLDKQQRWIAGFNTQKLLQSPPAFGTGCIVRTAHCPELFDQTEQMLRAMRFHGVAEVEYKWDARIREYRLIEVNPRLWDQHRLGRTCGVDLAYIAYCDEVGRSRAPARMTVSGHRWIAEDTLFNSLLRALLRRDRSIIDTLRLLRGKRVYAIWSAKDPLPMLMYIVAGLIPQLIRAVWHRLPAWRRRARRNPSATAPSSGHGTETRKAHARQY